MKAKGAITLYRVAKNWSPSDAEYLSPQEQGRKPRKDATAEELRSQDALSFWDTEEGARRIGLRYPKSGTLIVRYDIPEGSGIRYEPTIALGHYDLRGDKEELKTYLAKDFRVGVQQGDGQGEEQ